jgi:transposase
MSVMKVNTMRLDPSLEQLQTMHIVGDRVSALWNAANYACRQGFFVGEKIPSSFDFNRAFQGHDAYRVLPVDIAQEVLQVLREAWSSYFVLRARWKAGKLKDKPGLPKYRKDRKTGQRPTDWIPIKCDRSYRVESRTVAVTLPRDLRGQGRLVLSYWGIRRYHGAGRRAVIRYDQARGRWYFQYSVEVPDNAVKPWPGVAGIDLGIRVLVSLSIAGVDTAFHFLGREVLKDWMYWTRKIAEHQRELAHRHKKTSKRLKRLYAMRRSRLQHAWDAMARRVVAICRRHKVGKVVIGWPRGILDDNHLSRKWNGLTHGFWSFEQVSQRLMLALRRAGIVPERVGERGTSSHCPRCQSPRVVRRPRHLLKCRDCELHVHSDQAGSFNIIRQKYPVFWDGAEAAPAPETHRFNLNRWVDAYNPSASVEDRAA